MTEQEKNQLIEEAKQRFPIGCKFINTVGEEYVLQSDNYTYKISANNSVWAQSGAGCLYQNGKWAEIISKPESNLKVEALKPTETKFEVGKWYKINNCWYAKFNTIHGQGTFWQYTESITFQGIYNKLSDNIKMSSIKDGLSVVLLTDLSEIQQYLPDNHPDKIKVMKEESLVGRYLKALIDYPNCGGVKKDEYGLIIRHENNSLTANFPSQKNYACSLALEKSQTKYQIMPIGFTPDNIIPEYVECIKLDSQLQLGKTYLVDKEKGYRYNGIIEPVYYLKELNDSSYYQSYFKPSTKEAFEAQSKSTDTNWIPKVGEYVIVLQNYSNDVIGSKDEYNGQLAKLTNYYSDGYKGNKIYKYEVTILESNNTGVIVYNVRKAEPHEIPNNEIVLTPETYGYLSNRYFISVGAEEHSITPKQAIKSIFDKDYSSPLNEVLELPKSSKKKTKQLIY